jgi:hypothetical protein
MAFHTGNKAVVEKLQRALQAFLDDQRTARVEFEQNQPGGDPHYAPPEDGQGCGCNDCMIAGQLLGSIY